MSSTKKKQNHGSHNFSPKSPTGSMKKRSAKEMSQEDHKRNDKSSNEMEIDELSSPYSKKKQSIMKSNHSSELNHSNGDVIHSKQTKSEHNSKTASNSKKSKSNQHQPSKKHDESSESSEDLDFESGEDDFDEMIENDDVGSMDSSSSSSMQSESSSDNMKKNNVSMKKQKSSKAQESEEDDDDAPIAVSFKSAKMNAINAHHEEMMEAKRMSEKEREKRRHRTQLLQEQSKQNKSKNRAEMEIDQEQDEDDDDDEDLLPAHLIKQAINQISASDKQEEIIQDINKAEERRKRKELAKAMQEQAIRSKMVTVVPLYDSSGSVNLQQRKQATLAAESFLNEHFWGGRLERMRSDLYLSERTLGPSKQFIVPESLDPAKKALKQSKQVSLKEKRKAILKKLNDIKTRGKN